MSKTLIASAKEFLHSRFPRAILLDKSFAPEPKFATDPRAKTINGVMAFSFDGNVTHLLLAVESCGDRGEVPSIAGSVSNIYANLEATLAISISNKTDPHSNIVRSQDAVRSRLIILYTDKLCADSHEVKKKFESAGYNVLIVDESNVLLHVPPDSPAAKRSQSVLISYGGPDESFASRLNAALKSHGVRTWFFPDDALPGEKLHRVMHKGIHEHERMLLICSRASLDRHGVLNEIEKALEREAAEGGTTVLLPIRLDDYLFSDWNPTRSDLKEALRVRVIADFKDAPPGSDKFNSEIRKILKVLQLGK